MNMMTKSVMVLLLMLCATPALAQENVEQAQKHFETGAEWYAQGEYAKAIVEFLKGHNLSPNAMFLYNISLSYAKLENIDDALEAAERAIREGGLPPEVAVRNEARIRAFRLNMVARSVSGSVNLALTEKKSVPDPEPTPSGSSFGALGWTGVALTTVGVGLGVGAFLVSGGVSDDIEALKAEANGGDLIRYTELKSSVEDGQSTGQLLVYTGAGLGAVGITLILIDLFSGSETNSTSWYIGPQRDGIQAGFLRNF